MKHKSVDPAPPLALNSVAELSAVLKDQETPLFERYRAMFALREEGSAAAVQVACVCVCVHVFVCACVCE